MLKNLIVLPDGTELFSGAGLKYAIKSVKITEIVNSEDELTIGSACANMVEATVFSPEGGLSLTAGDEVTLYKVNDAGTRTQVGVFTLEKPTRPTANTMKLTGYDHVAKLDKDLTEWLKSLTGWPYTLPAFAGMVCRECGLTFSESQVPNSNFPIQQFFKSGVTGRQIMRWLGEICCRFVRATAAGDIEFGWYTPVQKSITPSGDPYIFAGGLSYETFQVAPVDAVQLRLIDSTDGALWPTAEEGANSYIISGNAILLSRVTEDLLPYLETIKTELSAVTYTPCKVSIPANLDIKAGNIVDITDKNGKTITAYVMNKTSSGQKDTLECTGSPRRDSSSSVNNKSAAEKAAEAERYANSAAQQAVDKQTQEDIFNKLTDGGKLQGLYIQDGKLYINAEFVKIINMIADNITSGKIQSKDGNCVIDLDNGTSTLTTPVSAVFEDFTVSTDTMWKKVKSYLIAEVKKMKTGTVKNFAFQFSASDISDGALVFLYKYTDSDGFNSATAIFLESDGTIGSMSGYDEASPKDTAWFLDDYSRISFSEFRRDNAYTECYRRFIDGKEEWINPPMEQGIEYRTTDRWKGMPVYTILLGVTVEVSGMYAEYSSDSVTPIRASGYIGPYLMPVGMSHATPTSGAHMVVVDNQVKIYCESTLTGETAQVQVWYIKQQSAVG